MMLVCLAAVIIRPNAAWAQTTASIEPLPLEQHLDQRKVILGGLMFSDPRLSGEGTISCASCHHLAEGGSDNVSHSAGPHGVLTKVKSPSVFNVVFNFHQFWDGRADTLAQQAKMAFRDPTIMNANWDHSVALLSGDQAVARQFKQIYPDGINSGNIIDAVVTFEQSLVTPNAPFDRYLRGDKAALTPDQVAGYSLFTNYGCISCHQGVNIGGNMFEALGVVGDPDAYFKARGHLTQADLGRYNVTHDEDDKYMFKVPSLRNVALRAPYLHDGSQPTLADAVRVMFKYQLGRTPSPRDVDLIVKFLDSLTGEYNGHPFVVPPSTAQQ